MLATEVRPALEEHAIAHAVQRLIRRYAGRHDPRTVRDAVRRAQERYAGAAVRAFVPILVERDARHALEP